MRLDFVLALDGDLLTVSDRKAAKAAMAVCLLGGSRTVVRVLMGESLTDDERAEVIETFQGELKLKSGRLDVSTAYSDEDDDEEDMDTQTVDLPKGSYRWSLHTTLAGPCVPEKVDKENLAAYFKRTRAGEPTPSWINPEEKSEDFWVGLILQLEPIAEVKSASPSKPLRHSKQIARPPQSPPGLRSDKPRGWERYVQTDLHYIHKIPKLIAKLEVEPVSGGPVVVPISDLILPYWIAWVCGETHPWIGVDCPAEFSPDWPGFRKGIKEMKTASGWHIDIEGMNARWSQFGHLRQVAELLSGLPDGSSMELACASDDGEGKKGRHRYIGSVSDGKWNIGLTHPAMNAETLRDMLDLVRQGETGTTVRARNDKEADAIATAIVEKDFLLRETPPQRKDTLFQVAQKDKQLMPFLIARVFAARYPTTLPMIERDDDLGSWDALMDKVAEAGASFATGDLVYEGSFAKFTLANLDELPAANHDLIKSNDEWLRGSGFQLLGDLNSTQTFQGVFRGYNLPGAPVYAAVIANGFGSTGFDFYTRFPDGFSLTTSAEEYGTGKVSADKKIRSYRNEVPGKIEDQWQAHLTETATLAERHGNPEPSGGLPEFAAELDNFFCRMHGIAKP
jgi:hypothetical protein